MNKITKVGETAVAGQLTTFARPCHLVSRFELAYDGNNGAPQIVVYFHDGSSETTATLRPPNDLATYIADVLRNDEPTWWDSERNLLTTGLERDVCADLDWAIEGLDASMASRGAFVIWQSNNTNGLII